MGQIPWHAGAKLVAPGRIYSADTLAQCVRRWARLTEEEKASVQIHLREPINGVTQLDKGQIAALAVSPDLKRV
jgi:hypothetical protein